MTRSYLAGRPRATYGMKAAASGPGFLRRGGGSSRRLSYLWKLTAPTTYFFPQPGARQEPVALHGFEGHSQRLRGFFQRQPHEEPALDDSGGTRIRLRQFVEGVVERYQLIGRVIAEERGHILERERDATGAPLFAFARPSMIDQNAPHGLGRNGKEVAPILGLQTLALRQSHVRLMDQRRCPERVAGVLRAQLRPRKGTKLFVNQGEQAVQRLGVPCSKPKQPIGDGTVSHRAWCRRPQTTHGRGARANPPDETRPRARSTRSAA